MIDLYYWTTPNGHKITMFLEETGLKYTVFPVNIGKGDQFKPEFLAIAPNNRIPALVDHEPKGGGKPISIFESGAMLLYLAEKTGKFLPADLYGRYDAIQWTFWQMGGLGPMAGQNHHFSNYAQEKIKYAIDRYVTETNRLYGVLNKRLADREFIAGDYSIADMASYPWIVPYKNQSQNIDDFPHLKRWLETIRQRPATPPLAALEIFDGAPDDMGALLIQRDCNYLQALEGDIDTSHFGFLHAGHVDPDDLADDDPILHTVAIRTPGYHIADTAWGTTYAGYRTAGPGRTSWRFGNFLFPFWAQVPNGEFARHLQVRGWVPLDDEHTMYCVLWWKRGASAMTQEAPAFKNGTPVGGMGRRNDFLPNTADWLGRFRLAANASNDWGMDRTAQHDNTIYSGID